mgnify:CR=1 FL=1
MGAWIETTASNPREIAVSVAPHVGAWIETLVSEEICNKSRVAPHVGAWIETDTYGIIIGIYRSHPMWVRGLKLPSPQYGSAAQVSHPMWVRGLKPYYYAR